MSEVIDFVPAFLFSNYCVNSDLARAVISQVGRESFIESVRDVVNYGIDGGCFSSFIYYSDTIAFALANRDSIGIVANNDASEMGLDGKFSLFASFKSLKDYDVTADDCASLYYERDESNENYTTFWNILAWYAAECVSRWYVDFVDNEMIYS